MIHRQKRDAFSIELTAKFTVFIAANAWATIATCRLCSETFSVRTLRISGQRLINFMRERWAKKWLCFIDYLLFSLRQTSLCGEEMKMQFRLPK